MFWSLGFGFGLWPSMLVHLKDQRPKTEDQRTVKFYLVSIALVIKSISTVMLSPIKFGTVLCV